MKESGIKKEALKAIASLSDGGVRDSLSLLDQLVSYAENKITIDDVDNLFGLLSIKDELRLVSLIEGRKTDECLHLVREKNMFKEWIFSVSMTISSPFSRILPSIRRQRTNPCLPN